MFLPEQNLAANFFYNTGCSKADLGDHEEAIISFSQALQIQANYPAAYCNRGASKQKLGRDEEAISDYNTAIHLQPNYPQAYCNRGMVKQKLGCIEDATADYQEALRQQPDFAEAKRFYEQLKEPKEVTTPKPSFWHNPKIVLPITAALIATGTALVLSNQEEVSNICKLQ